MTKDLVGISLEDRILNKRLADLGAPREGAGVQENDRDDR